MKEPNPTDEPDEKMVRVADVEYMAIVDRFHTKECKHYPENGRDEPRTVVEDHGAEQCSACAGEITGVAEDRQADRDYNELVEKLREEMDVEVQA